MAPRWGTSWKSSKGFGARTVKLRFSSQVPRTAGKCVEAFVPVRRGQPDHSGEAETGVGFSHRSPAGFARARCRAGTCRGAPVQSSTYRTSPFEKMKLKRSFKRYPGQNCSVVHAFNTARTRSG